MKTKTKIIKTKFSSGDFRIFSCCAIGAHDIQTNKFGMFSIKGNYGYLTEGQEYDLDLSLLESNQWGYTYQLNSCPTFNTTDLDYDASMGILREITTDAQAKTLLAVYPDVIKMILDGHEAEIDVKKLRNIKEYRLNVYIREIRSKFQYLSIMQENKQYDLTASECKELIRKFGTNEEVNSHLDKEPYECLIQLLGRDFQCNDKIILEQHEDLKFSTSRVESLIYYILKLNEDDSNTCMSANVMAAYTKAVAPELYDQIKSVSIDSDKFYYDENNKRIALSETYNSECMVADFVKGKLNGNKWDIDWKKYQDIPEGKLTSEQANVLKSVCDNDITILNAKGGTGKTSSMKAVVQMLEDNNKSYTLLSPTGRVAQRLTEITNRPASTIHRAALSGEIVADFICVEEFGMIGLDVMCLLINAITNKHTKFLFIGDLGQISPLSKGCIMKDLVESGLVPVCTLSKVFRYNEGGLSTVATKAYSGKSYLSLENFNQERVCLGTNLDYTFITFNNSMDIIIDEYKKLLDRGIKPIDISIISPWNVKEFGTVNINNHIQEIVNPIASNESWIDCVRFKQKVKFHKGDLVLNCKNDYDIQTLECYNQLHDETTDFDGEAKPTAVFNGEIGKVLEVKNDIMFVQFDERIVVFDKSNVNNLLLGYAMTSFKLQGSENKYIISLTINEHSRTLNKNVLYTNLTRARKELVEIGDKNAILGALIIDGIKNRNTFLGGLINCQVEKTEQEKPQ